MLEDIVGIFAFNIWFYCQETNVKYGDGCYIEDKENQISIAAEKELRNLEFLLKPLEVISNIAPLLGLLGTVIGMIETFQAITLFLINQMTH